MYQTRQVTRQATERVLELVEDGLLDRDTVIMACLKYMSEDDVKYMAPRTMQAGGKNGDVTVYGENANARKPPVINQYAEDEEISGLLQELGN